MNFINYIIVNQGQIISLGIEHIQLTVLSVVLAIILGVPLGILIAHHKNLDKPILGAANLIQAIPSMALLGFAIPFLGIGTLPAVVVVILYSLLPIIKNTYTGIMNINPQMLESARGIGLTKWQVLTKVQIPLALPVIMAGVRIAAVTAVGLMTIAAFIGAGGLGYLVFSGIRTVNNYQILAGAIPACILALLVDFILGQVEKAVTPAGKQTGAGKKTSFKWIMGITAAALCALFVFTFMTRPTQHERSIIVAGKDFTEQLILVEMVADIIEDRTDINVIRRPNLGGTQVCFGALKSGDIDLYIDYTGTAYGDTLRYPPITDMDEVYETVKLDFKEQFNIEVLPQYCFNNTYTLAVKPETARKYNLETFSDVAGHAGDLKVGATLEFSNREDGLPGLQRKYGFEFVSSVAVDGSQRYLAIMNNEVDVIDAFATDGLLKKFHLMALKDDKSFFPPYYAIPLVRGDILEKYPELEPVLTELGKYLDNETMVDLNYQVDELQKQPPDVAREFLLEKRLIKE